MARLEEELKLTGGDPSVIQGLIAKIRAKAAPPPPERDTPALPSAPAPSVTPPPSQRRGPPPPAACAVSAAAGADGGRRGGGGVGSECVGGGRVRDFVYLRVHPEGFVCREAAPAAPREGLQGLQGLHGSLQGSLQGSRAERREAGVVLSWALEEKQHARRLLLASLRLRVSSLTGASVCLLY
jgi:hypothetical protein